MYFNVVKGKINWQNPKLNSLNSKPENNWGSLCTIAVLASLDFYCTHPSARITHRRPFSKGTLYDLFSSMLSLRALVMLYPVPLESPVCHEGTRPQCIGWTTYSLSPVSMTTPVSMVTGSSVDSRLEHDSCSSAVRCCLDNKTGLQCDNFD